MLNSDPFAIIIKLPDWIWKIINYIFSGKYRGFGGVWPFVFYKSNKSLYEQGVIIHELEHIIQQTKQPFTFHIRYFYYHKKYGYKKNPYEIEARKAQSDFYQNKYLNL